MTTSTLNRIKQAAKETQSKLDKALSYSYDFQKPEQISFYHAHLLYLDQLVKSSTVMAPKPNLNKWDRIRCTC